MRRSTRARTTVSPSAPGARPNLCCRPARIAAKASESPDDEASASCCSLAAMQGSPARRRDSTPTGIARLRTWRLSSFREDQTPDVRGETYRSVSSRQATQACPEKLPELPLHAALAEQVETPRTL